MGINSNVNKCFSLSFHKTQAVAAPMVFLRGGKSSNLPCWFYCFVEERNTDLTLSLRKFLFKRGVESQSFQVKGTTTHT